MAGKWPTTATDADLYIAVNELQTNLASAVNSAVTSLPLNSATSFPTVGLVLIDNEVIKYTGISVNTLTGCTRGFDGTTAAAHSSSAVVSFAVMAAHHNVLKDEIEAVEADLANILLTITPAAAGATATSLYNRWQQLANQFKNLAGTTNWYDTVTAALLKSGGTMSGAIAMGTNKVTGLAAPTAAGDALSQNNVVPSSDGTVSAPGHTFSTDAASGLYKIGAGDIGIAASGVISAEVKTTGTANATTYTPFNIFGGPSNRATGFDKQATTGVTTSAATVYTLTRDGALVLVYGKGTAGTTAEFFDVVAFAGGGLTVIASTSGTGSPDARTYSRVGIALQLAMAAHTYTVACATVTMQG